MGVQQKYGTINKFYKRRYLEGDWLQSFNLLHFENKTSRLDGTGGVAQSRRGLSEEQTGMADGADDLLTTI